jgi:hypothetical protein
MARATAIRAALLASGLILLWSILFVNAVLYGEGNRPVLRIDGDPAARSASLQEALRNNPAEVAALLDLAAERARDGDAAAARRAYLLALEIAPIDPLALRAAAAFELSQGRTAEAMPRLDRLAALYGESREWIFPLFVRMMDAGVELAAFDALAAQPSSWIGSFIEHACAKSTEPARLAPIMLKRSAASGARLPEIRCVTDRLRRAGQWELAYQVWLNTLPRERLADVGFVFNGGFEHAPSGAGFDWIAEAQAPSHVVEYPVADSGAPGRRALRVTYTGKRASGPAIRQYLAVAPGRYELTGLARMEALQSVRGLQWILRCEGAEGRAQVLAASPRFIGSNAWERFTFEVNVPASCPGQVLALEPVGLHEGTTFISGKAWFDELRLARLH